MRLKVRGNQRDVMKAPEPKSEGSRTDRERQHFDHVWADVRPYVVQEPLRIPGIASLEGRRVLVCSCGSGFPPVMAAKAGAEVHAVDISPVAVRNAVEFAAYNGVAVNAQIMDLHQLDFPDGFFDIVYGSAVLHHLDPRECGREFGRVLRPGGIGFFQKEPCDRNAVLRLADLVVFGRRGGTRRRQRLLFLKRLGSEDEAPLSRQFEDELRQSFPGDVQILHSEFVFFQKLSHLTRERLLAQTSWLDGALARFFPVLLGFSYHEDILLRRAG